MLILNEATSALDAETEAQVVEAISNLQGEITMIVIAHRLSTIQKYQSILVFEHGKATFRALSDDISSAKKAVFVR
jgi:ATP-binding cassette subfamily C protein